MNITSLIERLKSATYRDKGDKYDYHVISSANAETVVNRVISEWASEQISDVELNRKCGELEAKCYAYEKIIANSNFAPIMQEKPKEEASLERLQLYIIDVVHNTINRYFDVVPDDSEAPMTPFDSRLLTINKEICNRIREVFESYSRKEQE